MSFDAGRRQRKPEWMDAPNADPELIRRSLAYIRRINSLLGYTRQTLGHIKRFSRNWKPGQTIWMLDLGTGSADIPRAILRWADKRGYDVRIVGLDLHPEIVVQAFQPALTSSKYPAEHGRLENSTSSKKRRQFDCAHSRLESLHHKLKIIRGDALNPPFADRSFDYVLTAMFLHHLDDDQAEQVLSQMNRLARRGVVAADLLRHRRAYFWISLFTLFANPMVRHDARVSVAQAFNRQEVFSMRERAGLEFARFHPHFGHRFAMAGER